MSHKTPLYQEHEKLDAKCVDFAGYLMPIHYGSQIEEHHTVRRDCGMFDVSHMLVSHVHGPDAKAFLRYLLANDVAKLEDGKALYSGMLNPKGGVIDDLIVYQVNEQEFRIISNAGTRDKVIPWLNQQAKRFEVSVEQLADMAIIAIQGPNAIEKFSQVLAADVAEQVNALKPFRFILHDAWQIARTGYTGEDGVEVVLPATQAVSLWQQLLKLGVKPIGLGARDTLRLEAGFNLYGQDMDETTSPLIANMGWTVAMKDERDFIGRDALAAEKAKGVAQQLVGLVLLDKGVLRAHQPVLLANGGKGETTSGSFSPTLGKSIALARLPIGAEGECEVEIRNRKLKAKIVKPNFVKQGKSVLSIDSA